MEVPSSSGIPCITLDSESEMETAGSTSLNSSLGVQPVTHKMNVNNQQEDITKKSSASSIDYSQLQKIVERLNKAKGPEREGLLGEMRVYFDGKSDKEFENLLSACVNITSEEEEICSFCQKTFNSCYDNIKHIILIHNASLNCSKLMKILEHQGQSENINQTTNSGNSKNTINEELRRVVDKCNRAKTQNTRMQCIKLLKKDYKKTQNTRMQCIKLLKKDYPHYLIRFYVKLVRNMYNKSQNQWICTICKKSYSIKRALLAKHLIVEHGFPLEFGSDNDADKFEIKRERDDKSEKETKPLVKQDKIQTLAQRITDDSKKLLFFTIYLAKSFPVINLEPLRELFENLEYDLTIFQTLTENRNKYREYVKNAIVRRFIEYLVRDIGESIYSIFINQYTNGNEKFLLLIIKYFSSKKNRIHTSFYRIIKIESENYAIQIIVILNSDGLNIAKCGGFGLDTETNENLSNSITHILKNVNSRIVINMCSFQSLLSIVTKACSYLPEDLAIMVKETYNCTFNSECREKHTYITLQNTEPLIYNHQWFMEVEVIRFIINQWNILKQDISSIDNIFAKKLFEDENNLINLLFIHEILGPLLLLYNSFSKESFDSVELFQDLRSILKLLSERQSHLNQPRIKGLENGFATKIYDCLRYLLLELNKLVPEESHLLHQVALFSRKKIPIRSQLNVSNIFMTYHSMSNIQLAEKEWNLFLQEDERIIPDGTTENCWIKIKDCVDFKHISQFVLQMLCLPFSNVDVKRIFDLSTKFINGVTNELPIEIVEAFVIIQSQTEPNIVQICAEQADSHV